MGLTDLKISGSAVRKAVRAFVNKVPAGARVYVKKNWGAPFVVGFMMLLVVAAVCLLMGFVVLADEVAVCGYYALVVGVVLQLGCFLRGRKRDGELSQ